LLRILGDIANIASVSRLDLNEKVSVFTTEHFFNGLLAYPKTPPKKRRGQLKPFELATLK